MGDLERDTDVACLGDGRYRAEISEDWRLMGPNGGYLAAIALRAAGAHSGMARPASLVCHYLGSAAFRSVDIEVLTMRTARRARALRVTMTQRGRRVLEAMVWAVDAEADTVQRCWIPAPQMEGPKIAEGMGVPELGEQIVGSVPFWENLEIRPVFLADAPRGVRGTARLRAWHRFRPRATFSDAWLDACRALVLIDTSQFPAVVKGVPRLDFVAPSLDLYVAFHDTAPEAEWLLVRAAGLGAARGVAGGEVWVQTEDGRLLATGAQVMLCRALPGR